MSNNKTDVSEFDITKIPIAFSPSDFFYLTVGSDMPLKSWCDNNKNSVENCIKVNKGTIDLCYQKELCANREMADSIFLQRNSHGESDVKLNDIYSQYMNEYMKTINLGVGIILSLAFIYYNR
jgi:hypothetical protein